MTDKIYTKGFHIDAGNGDTARIVIQAILHIAEHLITPVISNNKAWFYVVDRRISFSKLPEKRSPDSGKESPDYHVQLLHPFLLLTRFKHLVNDEGDNQHLNRDEGDVTDKKNEQVMRILKNQVMGGKQCKG